MYRYLDGGLVAYSDVEFRDTDGRKDALQDFANDVLIEAVVRNRVCDHFRVCINRQAQDCL